MRYILISEAIRRKKEYSMFYVY